MIPRALKRLCTLENLASTTNLSATSQRTMKGKRYRPDVHAWAMREEAEVLAMFSKAEMPEPKRIRELYLAAFSREPTADEVKIAETHLLKPRTDAAGKPLDSQRAKRNGYENLLWALLNTKEFLFNH